MILVHGLHGIVPQRTRIVDLVVYLQKARLQVVRVVGVMQLSHQLLLVSGVVGELAVARVATADHEI